MKNLFLLLLTLPFIFVQGQNFKYGKVSKEELAKEKSAIAPEAAGEILYEKARFIIEFNTSENRFYLTKEVEGRIKIYDKDKLDDRFLNKEIRLYAPSSTREKLTNISAATNNLENDKIETTKVRSSDIFEEEKNKYWDVNKFAFPNVKNGSVLEYKYTILSPFYREIDRWYFQDEIPVVYSQFTFVKPEFFIYSQDERGEIRVNPKMDQRAALNMNFDNTITEYLYENVNPLKEEPYVLNPNNLKASIRFELMKFEHPGFITENYATSWTQIGKDFMDNSSFGGQMSGNGFLDKTVQSISGSLNSPLEKTQAIFNYVKSNYSWDGFYSPTANNGVRSTFKDKTGNAADINLMLVSMLQKAGLDAAPVVLSTVQNLMINYTFPSVTSLDFVIASVMINNKLYLMDATEKYSNINMLPLRDLNYRGFRISTSGVQEISLTNYALSSNKEILNVQLDSDGTASGNYSETKDQYLAMTDKMSEVDNPKEFQKDYLSQYSFDVDSFKIDENAEKGILRYTFKFEGIKGAELVGDKMLLDPLFFIGKRENSFTRESRNYPLEFGSLLFNLKFIKIKIPEGYKVESLPENSNFVVENNVAGYSYKIEEKEGFILVTTIYELAQSILPASYYKAMKDFENQQVIAENQQVVLVKK